MNIERSKISIVIPVYNAEGSLPLLIPKIKTAMELDQRAFELILVNDGSADDSWNVIQQLANRNDFIVGINLMRNYGQHNALLCGVRQAQYETIVTMDDDLQHPPEAIHILLEKLEQGYDVIFGSPTAEKHGLFRDLASVITKVTLSTVMNAKSARHVSAFRAFRTCLRDAFANYQGPSVSLDVLLTWGTARISYIEVQHNKRAMGTSNYTFRKLVSHALTLLTGFSTIPLRLATGIGFIFLLFGMLVFLYVMIHFLIVGGVVPGFTFLASIIVIFAGVQLFCLGMIGEYLARMHFRLMDKPTYVIKTIKNNCSASEK
jgi:glycosyltransferase involved in cell wall biosynthesis